jgi:hypothetical protein
MKAYRLAGTTVMAVLAAGCTPAAPIPPAPSAPAPSAPAPSAPALSAPALSAPAPATSACAATVRKDVLPEWARAGFSDPSPSGIPYVLGARGDILGVIFGYPLTAPLGPDRANKILWNANPAADGPSPAPDDVAPEALRIEARLAGTAEVVRREVPGGPGPSIIDLPRAGCWRLTLTWANHTDTLDLRYESRG